MKDERIKEIRDYLDGAYALSKDEHVNLVEDLANELINEVERLQEYLDNTTEAYWKSVRKSEEYREALQFYSIKGNYAYDATDEIMPIVNIDGGKRAKEALK